MTPLIVVTDLDGTLLDHSTYDFSSAARALEALRRLRIPLVLNSSKTAAEMREWCTRLHTGEPFISENGGGITCPGAEPVVLGAPRALLIAAAHRLRTEEGFKFRGFADMSAEELAELTGLDLAQARLALQRDFSEPLQWLDSEARLQDFQWRLKAERITLQRGGRFLHLSGGADKAQALPWLRKYYSDQFATPPRIIALGDNDNDRAMLEAADFAVWIRSGRAAPPPSHPRICVTDEPGPSGWNRAILDLLRELSPSERR